jgi:YjbE family integral membrane protein
MATYARGHFVRPGTSYWTGLVFVDFASFGVFGALLQVILIDLVLAGDNAVVIGLAAAGLEPALRKKAIIIGILAATVLRIIFALIATQLLAVVGLLLAGGVLLLWVCWKMWQELHHTAEAERQAQEALENADLNADGAIAAGAPRKTLRQAVIQIIVADVSMSLDNVLAVAGAAQHHTFALIFGLALSVLMMGAASAFIANLLHKHRWIAYLGLAVILFVAVRMVWHGADEVLLRTGNAGLPHVPFF